MLISCLLIKLDAVIDFEQVNYTFLEGTTGSICVTITNPVTIDVQFIDFPVASFGN